MTQNLLRSFPLFQDLNDDQLKIMTPLFHEYSYPPGGLIFQEGIPRTGFYIVLSGHVEIYHQLNHKRKKVVTFNAGKFIGESIFLEHGAHTTAAQAIDDVILLRLAKEDIVELEENAPRIYTKLLKRVSASVARRLKQANRYLGREYQINPTGDTRTEHDLLGDREVPEEVLYGIQTLRALENFSVTRIPISHHIQLIRAMAFIKKAAVLANHDLKLISLEKTQAIVQACDEILMGQHYGSFVVDMIQGGAGTSTNMNANEVIANRALEIMGHPRGSYEHLHPNSDVNMAQSTNDVYPTAIRLGILLSYEKLKKSMTLLSLKLLKKGEEFYDVIKVGRTQLQDAVPMTMGQEFRAWGHMIEKSVRDLEHVVRANITTINIGGTAIGTGLTADPGYQNLVLLYLKEFTGINDLKIAPDLIMATQDTSDFVSYSSVLKNLAIKLSKIASDLRLLGSGPRSGLNELNLPPMQPGSTIMPGKVNPVIPEMVNQVAYQVIGNDLTVNMASEAGQLELNVMEPVITFNLFQSQNMLTSAMTTFTYRAIDQITVNKQYCREMVKNSISLITALNPYIGYEKATEVAERAKEENRSVYDIALEMKLISQEKLERILQPENLVRATKKLN